VQHPLARLALQNTFALPRPNAQRYGLQVNHVARQVSAVCCAPQAQFRPLLQDSLLSPPHRLAACLRAALGTAQLSRHY
jgi:hypothetical protein